MKWKDIEPSDLEQLKDLRIQIHQAIQAVSAVGRHFLEPSPADENATLSWNRSKGSFVGNWVQTESGAIRAGYRMGDAYLYLENSKTIEEISINGKTFGQLMVWMEEQVGKCGLPIADFSANLPYELPPYPKLSAKGFDIAAGELVDNLASYYASSFEILDMLQWDFEVEAEVMIYPHHFDQALSMKLKDSGDLDTSSYLTLGMSPGDEHFDQPYFYVNCWPHADESVLKPLTAGSWYSSDWIGGVVTAKELWEIKDQKNYLLEFYRQASSQLHAFLLD